MQWVQTSIPRVDPGDAERRNPRRGDDKDDCVPHDRTKPKTNHTASYIRASASISASSASFSARDCHADGREIRKEGAVSVTKLVTDYY
eukprot:2157539-Rhodomonas_salina.2